MSEESKPKWDFREYFILGLFMFVVILIGTYEGYKLYLDNVSKEGGTNRIDNLVGIVGILLNILTVFLVYLTFQNQSTQVKLQRVQIENQKIELDIDREFQQYNRVIDFIYGKIDDTNKKLNTPKGRIKQLGDVIADHDFDSFLTNRDNIYYHCTLIFNEVMLYVQMLERSNKVSDNNKSFLFTIFYNRLDDHTKSFLENYQILILMGSTYKNIFLHDFERKLMKMKAEHALKHRPSGKRTLEEWIEHFQDNHQHIIEMERKKFVANVSQVNSILMEFNKYGVGNFR